MEIKDFINELKGVVKYNKQFKVHILGGTVLTKKELRHMLSVYFIDEFIHYSNAQQNKYIDQVFKELE